MYVVYTKDALYIAGRSKLITHFDFEGPGPLLRTSVSSGGANSGIVETKACAGNQCS